MSGRRALIVATGTHDDTDLRQLRSPAQDAPALARVLADPDVGDFEVTRLVDEPQHLVARALEDFFAESRLDDLLVVHLSCHGVKDDDGRLYFAARDTNRRRLASTAVAAAYLNDLMERCRARSIVLLLDCCYSGAFVAGAKGDDGVHLKERLTGHGRAVLTASNAIEYAWEGDELSGDPEASVFTAAIVDGLTTGEADRDGDGTVSIEDLYRHVYERVRESGRRQTPLLWSFGVAGTVRLARNPRPVPQAAPAAEPVAAADPVPVASTDPAPVAEAGAEAGASPARPRRPRRLPVLAAGLALVLVAVVAAVALRGGGDGDGDDGGSGGEGAAAGPVFAEPAGVAVGPDGEVYVSERGANRVSRIEAGPDGATVGTVAGTGEVSNDFGDGGPATAASLSEPSGLAVSGAGELHIADTFHGMVRRIEADGTIVPVAGTGVTGDVGDGGPAVAAELGHPTGVAVAADGTVYVSDVATHRVHRVGRDGVITLVAGSGTAGYEGDGGPAAEAVLDDPRGVAVAEDGSVYVADTDNNRIRRIDPAGTITTVAGTGVEGYTGDRVPAERAALALPEGLAFGPDGRLYIADTHNHRIRRLEADGTLVTVVGDGEADLSGDGGPAVRAALDAPTGVAVADDGTIWIADTGNDRVRRVDPRGTITTVG